MPERKTPPRGTWDARSREAQRRRIDSNIGRGSGSGKGSGKRSGERSSKGSDKSPGKGSGKGSGNAAEPLEPAASQMAKKMTWPTPKMVPGPKMTWSTHKRKEPATTEDPKAAKAKQKRAAEVSDKGGSANG